MPITAKQALLCAVVSVGRRCFYCGKRAHHADHITPKKDGGGDRAENLVPSCKTCNCRKSNKPLAPEQFKKALAYAFTQAPLIIAVAENFMHCASKRTFDGLLLAVEVDA